jgi:hypothetical protein
VKFVFISEEKVALPVAALCRVLRVAPSGYWAGLGSGESPHSQRADLTKQIAASHDASKPRHGSPVVHADLKASGHRVGCKRVAMKENGLVARHRRRFRATTNSKHSFTIAPNLLERASRPDAEGERNASQVARDQSLAESLVRAWVASLGVRCQRRHRATTDSKHSYPMAPNLLERASCPDASWATEITLLWTQPDLVDTRPESKGRRRGVT